MTDAVLAMCERIVYQFRVTGIVPGPEGNGASRLVSVRPVSRVRWLGEPGRTQRQVLGTADGKDGAAGLARHPRYRSNDDRIAQRGEVESLVSEWTSRYLGRLGFALESDARRLL